MTLLQAKESCVVVRTQLEALHHWPHIPNGHPSQFLKYPHRHVFHIELRFKVDHNDRDIEFIEMKHRVDDFLQHNFKRDVMSGIIDLGVRSCEMLCEELLQLFNHLGAFQASVFEDGELGSIVTIEL